MISSDHTTVPNTKALQKIKLQRPIRAGGRWQGVPHHTLISTVEKIGGERGWKPEVQCLIVANAGADLTAVIRLDPPAKIRPPAGCLPCLGLQSSNSGRKVLQYFVGWWEPSIKSGYCFHKFPGARYEKGLDLTQEIDRTLDEYQLNITCVRLVRDEMERTELKPTRRSNLLVAMGAKGYMPWSRVGRVDEEQCRLAEQYQPKGEVIIPEWTIMQAFSTVVGMNTPVNQMESLHGFYKELVRSRPLKK